MKETKKDLDDFFGEDEPEDLLPAPAEKPNVPATASPDVVDNLIHSAAGITATQPVTAHLQKHLVDLLYDMKSLDKDTTYRGLLAKHQLRKSAVDITTRIFEQEAGDTLDSRVMERTLQVIAKFIHDATYIPSNRKKQITRDLLQALKMNIPEIIDLTDSSESGEYEEVEKE